MAQKTATAAGAAAAQRRLLAAQPATVAAPSAPYTQCPPIGADTSCAILIQVTDSANNIFDDPSQGPYDGSDDTLVGVVNSSSQPLTSLALSSDTILFGFDGDGICSGAFSPMPAGCPFGPTGYEGPGTSFSNISPDTSGGVVNFATPVAPGQTAYFSLEERLSATAVVVGGPSAAEQGAAPNPAENRTTCSTPQPVNCATGEFWHQFTDFTIPGRGVPLALTRTYISANAAADGPLGFGWADSYAMSLSTDVAGNVTVRQENGSTVTFQPNGYGGFTAPPRVLATLTANADGTRTFSRYADHVQYVFDATGQLQSEVDPNGYRTTLAYNGTQLTSVTDPAGRALTLTYSGSHISKVTDPAGDVETFGYDAAGNLTSATDAAGRAWKFGYDAGHLLLTMTDPRGGTTTNVYDANGRVLTQTDPKSAKTSWAYTGNAAAPGGGTTTMTDPNGNVTTYDFADLELRAVTHATGTAAQATTTYTYDPATLGVEAVTDPDGHVTTTGYDHHGNAISRTDALGRSTGYGYDALDKLVSVTTPQGETTTVQRDGAGNVLAVADQLGKTTTYGYADTAHPGDVTTTTDRDGRATTFAYDGQGNVVSVTTSPASGVSDTTTYVYDADGRRTCQASANATATHVACPSAGAPRVAGTTTWTYDEVGQLTAVTDPNGHTTSYGYDADGNTTKVTAANGNVTGYAYDADNQQVSVTRADGTTTTSAYDANGNQTGQTDAAGKLTAYGYDQLDRVVSVTDPLGRATGFAYDAAGNRTAATDPSGRTTTWTYDAANQLTAVSYSDGTTPNVSYSYTADGRRDSMTDATGTTRYAYDVDQRLISVTNGAGAVVGYGYDASGNVTTLTYPNGKTVTRTYDSAGRLSGVQDWLGNTTTLGHDANGNLTSQAYPNGVQAASTYDAADQLMSIVDKGAGSTLANFAYGRDNLGQVTSDTATGVPGSPVTYSYTKLNQLATQNSAPYGYDRADNLTTLPDGTTQAFDAANQLQSATPPAGAGATPTVDKIANGTQARSAGQIVSAPVTTSAGNELLLAFVSADGPANKAQKISKVTGGGMTWTLVSRANSDRGTAEVWQAYATQQLKSVKVTATLGVTGWDGAITVAAFTGAAKAVGASASAGARQGAPSVKVTTTKPNSIVWASGHDWDRDLKRVPVAGQSVVNQVLDTRVKDTFWVQKTDSAVAAAGTTVTVADTAPTTDRWELAAVEIMPASTGPVTGSAVTYSYDKQGNRVGIAPAGSAATTLTYDQANRLTAYGSSATYAYDGDGLRMSKTVNGAATAFTWDESGQLPLLLGDGADWYVYGEDGVPIEKITGSTVVYLHQDQQGSTRLLTDAAGTVVGAYSYDAYGKTTAHTGTVSSSLQYDGQYTDAETGYQYMRARYYDPGTGQFLSRDPVAALTRSPYGYADGDPVNGSDPSGQFTWATAGVGAAIGFIAGGVVSAGSYAIRSVVLQDEKFSWYTLGAETGAGAINGGITGACDGFTLLIAAIGCSAAGGAAGEAYRQWAENGSVTDGSGVFAAGVTGGLGRWFHAIFPRRDPFPLQGRRPSNLLNVVNPGKNAQRMYGNKLSGLKWESIKDGLKHLINSGPAC